MRTSIHVNLDLCCHCGQCVQDCVTHALILDDADIPAFAEGKEKNCVGCQHCMAICPTGALSFGGKNPEDSLPVGMGKSDDLLRLIQSRRSIRFYKKEDVGQEMLGKLSAMLPYIPTGGNADNLYFTLIGSRKKMDAIRKTTYECMAKASDPSPMFIMARDAYAAGNDVVYRGAPSLIAVAIDKEKTIPGCEMADPIIALSYCELYAQSLGLGTLWCDYAVLCAKQIPEVMALLEIPQNYELVYILLFGLPAVHYARTIQPELFTIRVLQ
ncbi:MAG: nitroreductase family protein [Desulfovibrionaceae bacterium]|nr:nitroreductase family protein [Desulfovibrionaceae bacterium]